MLTLIRINVYLCFRSLFYLNTCQSLKSNYNKGNPKIFSLENETIGYSKLKDLNTIKNIRNNIIFHLALNAKKRIAMIKTKISKYLCIIATLLFLCLHYSLLNRLPLATMLATLISASAKY